MSNRIAVFGGSFNPPSLHHRELVTALAKQFDRVIIVPHGPRPDKPATNDVEPIHRAVMNDLAFRGIPNVRLELFDLEALTFTRTDELERMFASEGEIWHVVGSDLIQNGSTGESFIHRVFDRGPELWDSLRFAVVRRSGFEIFHDDLPPNHEIVDVSVEGSTFAIREQAFRRQSLEGMVTPEVASYIDRYRLYRGTVVSNSATWREDPRLLVFHDERNPKAVAIAERFSKFASPEPNCILAIGGDGTMLAAIRQHWRMRLPFFGVNAGHLGYLLNGNDRVPDSLFPDDGITLRHLPMLYVETHGADGVVRSDLCFNDTWLERAGSQTAWIEVKIDGQVRLPKLVADGVLMSTAAGSTAYARSMGAAPLLADTPAIVIVGSNVMQPPGFRSALLGLDSEVEWTSLGGEKRPLIGYVDGIPQGNVVHMKVRASRIAAAELGFMPDHDMAEKIAQLQFPNWGSTF